jgi:hypothetical protein
MVGLYCSTRDGATPFPLAPAVGGTAGIDGRRRFAGLTFFVVVESAGVASTEPAFFAAAFPFLGITTSEGLSGRASTEVGAVSTSNRVSFFPPAAAENVDENQSKPIKRLHAVTNRIHPHPVVSSCVCDACSARQ